MLNFLPNKLKNAILKLGIDKLSEIRIRNGRPVEILLNGDKLFLEKYVISKTEVEEIVLNACKRSIYSYDEQIKQGYITSDCGERIGLAGELVIKGGNISAIKDFSSLCIRIPHQIIGVSNLFFNKVYKGGSVLIISPPAVGKTTFLRDFTRELSSGLSKNVVVVDERNEIACFTGDKAFDLGACTDVLTYSDKTFGLNQALRTLNPEIVVVDELVSIEDVNSVIKAIFGGVSVVATVHSNSIENLFMRDFTLPIKNTKPFDYYVVIEIKNGNRYYRYYNRDFVEICF